jgi:hypothetical protein
MNPEHKPVDYLPARQSRVILFSSFKARRRAVTNMVANDSTSHLVFFPAFMYKQFPFIDCRSSSQLHIRSPLSNRRSRSIAFVDRREL